MAAGEKGVAPGVEVSPEHRAAFTSVLADGSFSVLPNEVGPDVMLMRLRYPISPAGGGEQSIVCNYWPVDPTDGRVMADVPDIVLTPEFTSWMREVTRWTPEDHGFWALAVDAAYPGTYRGLV